jgi:hypothetical protein
MTANGDSFGDKVQAGMDARADGAGEPDKDLDGTPATKGGLFRGLFSGRGSNSTGGL